MAKIDAPVMRSVITDDEFGGYRIALSPTNRTRLTFSIAAAIWGCGVLLTLRHILNSSGSPTLQSYKPLLTWLCVALFLWFFAVMNGMIRETLIIAGKSLELRKQFAGFSKVRTFELADVRNLRAIRANDNHFARRPLDCVAFDHKGRIYRFGINLSEQEVLHLVKTIHMKVPIREDWAEVEPLPVLK